eukprot:4412056-Prymnesium_polylepis.1
MGGVTLHGVDPSGRRAARSRSLRLAHALSAPAPRAGAAATRAACIRQGRTAASGPGCHRRVTMRLASADFRLALAWRMALARPALAPGPSASARCAPRCVYNLVRRCDEAGRDERVCENESRASEV